MRLSAGLSGRMLPRVLAGANEMGGSSARPRRKPQGGNIGFPVCRCDRLRIRFGNSYGARVFVRNTSMARVVLFELRAMKTPRNLLTQLRMAPGDLGWKKWSGVRERIWLNSSLEGEENEPETI